MRAIASRGAAAIPALCAGRKSLYRLPYLAEWVILISGQPVSSSHDIQESIHEGFSGHVDVGHNAPGLRLPADDTLHGSHGGDSQLGFRRRADHSRSRSRSPTGVPHHDRATRNVRNYPGTGCASSIESGSTGLEQSKQNVVVVDDRDGTEARNNLVDSGTWAWSNWHAPCSGTGASTNCCFEAGKGDELQCRGRNQILAGVSNFGVYPPGSHELW